MAKIISCVNFNAAIVMFLFLSSSIGRAKGETDCKSVANALSPLVHEACKDLGSTSMCHGYCGIKSNNACTGSCNDGRCECRTDCNRFSKRFGAEKVFSRFPCTSKEFGTSFLDCGSMCYGDSGGNCFGKCEGSKLSSCKCFNI